MSDKSGIEWTEATWNPATGCTKVSPGCKFCYAKHKAWPRLAAMDTGVYSGRKFEDVQTHNERLDQPMRWTKPRMIFVNSMSDLFHEDISDTFISDVFNTMALSPQHTFQVLTKRAERMRNFVISDSAVGSPLPNVWLGVSVEDEARKHRIELLQQTPAAVRFISFEPLLSPVGRIDLSGIGWVIVGGESGYKARAMSKDWALDIRNQCLIFDVPFFMKQGSQANWPGYKNFDSFPPVLQVREYPR